ncbi:Rhs repeat-associated core [Paracoccaceae bacterium]
MHRDGLSSVRAITSAAGVKIESALYKPFGEQSEWLLPGNTAPETKGWIGERFDADAGLQYLNARYYDPELSLFLQPDWFEVTKPGVGTNRFSYSFNDPVNKFDPGGNDWNPTNGDEFDPEKTPPVYTKRTYIDDMTDVLRASGRIAYDAGAVAASVALPDFQELTNGDLTWNDALEVASIVPIGKVAKWGVGLIRGAETTADVTKVADGAVDATKTVCSFDGATLVLAKDGSRPIRDILPGKDLVWGLDADGKGDWHIVQGKTVATYDHKVMVVIRDVETGATQTITSNRIHPYFAQVPEGETVSPASEGFVYDGPLERGHWIDAGNLKPGYRLLNPDGTWAEVVSITETPATLDAWNLTVEGAHSYFVAETVEDQTVWVHNACRLPVAEAKAYAKNAGWVKKNERIKGQDVYYDPDSRTYYSYDADGHSGGTWKGAKSIEDLWKKETRLGTYDENLNWIAE